MKLLSTESLATISQTQAEFVPNLSVLRKSYQDEAYTAKQKQARMNEMEARLTAFRLGNITLYDLVSAFIEKGIALDSLLRQRAVSVTKGKDPDATKAGDLRLEIMNLLARLRANVRDEIDLNPDLPARLEVELFSYLDQLVESREAQAAVSAVHSNEDDTPESKAASE